MSETLKNLTKAFIGESQARNRYSIYAKIAQKENLHQISEIFLETAEQEREHAKWLFRMINDLTEKSGKEIIVEASAPTVLKDTRENLKSAIDGENHEFTEMYPQFADIAEKEGHKEIADRLRAIAKAESHHRDRYQKLLNEVDGNTVFKKDGKIYWICMKCGYIHEGEEPPEKCPSCDHPKEYFKRQCENY